MKKQLFFLVMLMFLAAGAWAQATLEVSQPAQVTNDSYYERGQSITYDGTDYWLFWGRSASCTDTYGSGNPDIHDYEIYYKKAGSISGLATASAIQVTGANNNGIYMGETDATYFGGEVWVFGPHDNDGVPGGLGSDLYAWKTTDGTSWTETMVASGLPDGAAHFAATSFSGNLWLAYKIGGVWKSKYYDGSSWSSEYDILTSSGTGKFFVEGTSLYFVRMQGGAQSLHQWGGTAWSQIDASAEAGTYDPTIVKVGSNYVCAYAPWVSPVQWVKAKVGTTLGTILSAGSQVNITSAAYGTNTWYDFWPYGFTDNDGDKYLFFTSERNPGDPTTEVAGNIWLLSLDWDVTRDHYTFIQEAVAAALSGDEVRIATGTYIENVPVNKPLTLFGAASGSRTLIQTTGTSHFLSVTAENVIIKDFEIEKTDDNVNQNIIYVGGNNFEMDNCEIHAQFVMGDGEVTRALEVAAVTGLKIHDNIFYDLRQPAYINAANGTIWNNNTYNTKGWVIVTESDLNFISNAWGTGSQPNYYDIAIIQNSPEGVNNYPDIVTMSGNNNDAIIENQHSTYSPAILSIVHVDVNTGATGNNGSILDPYTAISSAIPRVAVGGKILAAKGVYHERLTVNKSCRLFGEQYCVDPTATGARLNPADETVVDLVGVSLSNPNVLLEIPSGVTNVTIDGFTLNGSTTNHYADEATIRCWDDYINIQNNIIDGYTSILYKGNDYLTIDKNSIQSTKQCIVVQPNTATNLTISNNILAPNTTPDGSCQGIYMTSVSTGSISDNVSSGFSGSNGCGGSNLTQLTISGNTFSGNNKGINFWGTTTDITIDDNEITNSVTCGINIKGDYLTITDNDILNNGTGVIIDKHELNTDFVEIHHNTFSGNTTYSLEVGTAVLMEVDAEGNYWGSIAPSIVAAEVTGNADNNPWCNSDFTICSYTSPITEVWVDDDWAGYSDGDEVATGKYFAYNAFAVVQEGIDEIASGGTVNVAEGTYIENASTNSFPLGSKQGLKFIGETDVNGNPTTIINGSLYLNDNDDGCVENIKFLCDGTNNLLTFLNTNGLTVENCVFDGNIPSGSFLSGKNGINHVSGPNGNSGILVKDCQFLNGLYVGISSRFSSSSYFGHTVGLTVENCSFTNLKSGINHMGGNDVMLTNSDFSVVAQSNTSDTYGIRFASDVSQNLSITGCSFNVDRNGYTAVAPDYHAAIILRAAAAGILEVTGSSILGEVVNLSTTPFNAENNYWGDVTGPYDGSDDTGTGGLYNPGGLGDEVTDNVDYDPWYVNDDMTGEATTEVTNVVNLDQSIHYTSVQEAILGAEIGQTIQVTGTHNVKDIVVNKGLKIAAGAGGAIFNGLGLRGGTGMVINTTDPVEIIGAEFSDYDLAIDFVAFGTATITDCKFINNIAAVNNQTTVDIDAENNYWGAASGPEDDSPVGLYNPYGMGGDVSDYVDYQPWYISDDLNDLGVDIGIFNPTCNHLQVKARPNSSMTGQLTSLLFTVKWEESNYPDVFSNITSSYNLLLQYYETDGDYKYAVFSFLENAPVTWTAAEEYVILEFDLNQSQPEGTVCDFEIANDGWAFDNNGLYYIEYWGSDYTGYIYASAPDVYTGDCDLQLHLNAFLQGPYNTTTNEMNLDLNTEGLIPLAQPFGAAPWNYSGTESITSVPADMVDWVLVELRETATGTPFTRQAALLFKDGSVRSYVDSFFDVYFTGEFMPNSDFYAVIYQHNHMPVMTDGLVNIPNAGDRYDFSDMATYPSYGGSTAQVLLETGVHGMVSGDINGDGDLIYSGTDNDRALILQQIVAVTGVPYINGVIQGYYLEDLTMNSWVKYSGSLNDQRLIILNLIELEGVYDLNTVYESLVPGWGAKSPHYNAGSGPMDIALVENTNSLDVVLLTKENLGETWTDNIQFTLSWEENNVMMDQMVFNYTSDYLLEPQGEIRTVDGQKYMTFVVVDWLALPAPFNTGDQVTVLSLQKGSYAGQASKATIAQDVYTLMNNGGYFVSLIGQDKTGQVLEGFTGIDNPATASSALSLYPNPVINGQVTLSMMPAGDETITLTVSDVSGRNVHQESFQVTNATPMVKIINLEGFDSGTYLVRLKGTDTNKTGKIIVW